MSNVWTLVGLVGAVAVLLLLVFVIESEIHAKILEIKKRKIEKHMLKKTCDEIDKHIEEVFKDGFKE